MENKQEYFRNYRARNMDKMVAATKRWRDRNKDYMRNYWQRKKENNPSYAEGKKLHSRIVMGLKKESIASAETIALIGCDYAQLRSHLESLFQSGMTWENHGKWQIDHIVPRSKFDLTDPDQQKECFHYTNMQPLWLVDNVRKSNTL